MQAHRARTSGQFGLPDLVTILIPGTLLHTRPASGAQAMPGCQAGSQLAHTASSSPIRRQTSAHSPSTPDRVWCPRGGNPIDVSQQTGEPAARL
jgi:hypothetical protein